MGKNNSKFKSKYILPLILSGVVLFAGIWLGQAAMADSGDAPGTQEDPLVTASFVEEKFNDLERALQEERLKREQLEERLNEIDINGEVQPPPPEDAEAATPPSYEIVEIPAGKRLLTGQGTEVILRAGEAVAIAGEMGGMADLTAGENLDTRDKVNRDHLILSSRDDGRGVAPTSDAIFLVRGEYTEE